MSGATVTWEDVLTRLEHDVARVEQAVAAGEPPECPPWEPPVLTEPLPEQLVPRAVALIERQERAAAALTRASTTTARQRRVNGQLRDGAAEPRTAVYVDVRA